MNPRIDAEQITRRADDRRKLIIQTEIRMFQDLLHRSSDQILADPLGSRINGYNLTMPRWHRVPLIGTGHGRVCHHWSPESTDRASHPALPAWTDGGSKAPRVVPLQGDLEMRLIVRNQYRLPASSSGRDPVWRLFDGAVDAASLAIGNVLDRTVEDQKYDLVFKICTT